MNYNSIKIITALIINVFMLSCTQKECKTNIRAINPNGDSELGILMREMHLAGKEMRAAIKRGEKYTFSHDPEAILTAIATEPEKANSPEYKAFAKQYISIMKTYRNATVEESVQTYQAMVSSCQHCHEALCPGPLRAIEKLEI